MIKSSKLSKTINKVKLKHKKVCILGPSYGPSIHIWDLKLRKTKKKQKKMFLNQFLIKSFISIEFIQQSRMIEKEFLVSNLFICTTQLLI